MMVRETELVSVENEFSVTPSCNTDQGVHADTQAHGGHCQVHNKHYGWVCGTISRPQFVKRGMRVSVLLGPERW